VLALLFAPWARPLFAEADSTANACASDRETRDTLKAFARAWKSKDADERIDAVTTLGTVVHEKIVDKLLRVLGREDDPRVIAAVYAALERQTPFADRVADRLAKTLAEEAEAASKRLAKGDAGFRVDPRTGDADVTTPEGLTKLRESEARADVQAALLQTLARLGWVPEKRAPDLAPFLQDASDELVIRTLETLTRWQAWPALSEVLDLYRMYPDEYSWETGAVADLAGTNATAKAKWMIRFGHPQKQRARPRVNRAIRAFLEALTGRTFDSPKRLEHFLASPDTQQRMASGRRRR